MATGMFPRLVSLVAVALLAACQQGTSPAAQAEAKPPAPRHDDAVRALLQERYGAAAQLQGAWAQQLDDPNMDHVRPIHRELCADHGVVIGQDRYRMLAVCTSYDDATSIELGTTDFIVLREAADGTMQVAAEQPGRASGVGGKPGAVSLLQVGARAWAYQIDDELVVIGAKMRDRSWLLYDGGDKVADAGWLRVHLDDHNAIDCNDAGRCVHGRLDLNLDVRADDSQATLPYWPLRVQQTGTGCKGRVNTAHVIHYDPAQSRYQIPTELQLEGCD